MKQSHQSMNKKIEIQVSLDYLLHLPKAYKDGSEDFPMILFLHGVGARGRDIEKVRNIGLAKALEGKDDFPCIVVSPLCPTDETWVTIVREVQALVDDVMEKYKVDSTRVYLTGLSMGGYGAWHIAEAMPETFAAVAPICGGVVSDLGFPQRLNVLKDTPIWTFHGEADQRVPIACTEEAVNFMTSIGGNVKFTRYPDVGHNCWDIVYGDDDFYKWLLDQRLPK